MNFVPVFNCSVSCPGKTLCFRPEEFLEPILCVHPAWNLPSDLLNKPAIFACHDYGILVIIMLLCIVLILQAIQIGHMVFCRGRENKKEKKQISKCEVHCRHRHQHQQRQIIQKSPALPRHGPVVISSLECSTAV